MIAFFVIWGLINLLALAYFIARGVIRTNAERAFDREIIAQGQVIGD